MIVLKNKNKVILLYILEAIIIFACIYLTNVVVPWMVNLYGTSDTANVFSALSVIVAGGIIFVIVFIIGKVITKLYAKEDEAPPAHARGGEHKEIAKSDVTAEAEEISNTDADKAE